MSEHVCHAYKCEVRTPPQMLMCRRHWSMVPESLRAEIKAEYRPSQCRTKRPSRAWLRAAMAAVRAVAYREGLARPTPTESETNDA